ncbi:hypothetical protein JCM9157_39 [Halalkalibacter akibai JCM 9157]|uniref:Uncharacterized protein n=1 Tax=Halalkalibacter akibai (strain ATCC 43226 / DSM 21942 / CIP 109018 / JCM 9157 / 1139) TaxID=1236973 RepID=W4QN25_HALA3|nr:hypothetical protein JCM9157_39 [Halalkalibacter akibai JCM 9157]
MKTPIYTIGPTTTLLENHAEMIPSIIAIGITTTSKTMGSNHVEALIICPPQFLFS